MPSPSIAWDSPTPNSNKVNEARDTLTEGDQYRWTSAKTRTGIAIQGNAARSKGTVAQAR